MNSSLTMVFGKQKLKTCFFGLSVNICHSVPTQKWTYYHHSKNNPSPRPTNEVGKVTDPQFRDTTVRNIALMTHILYCHALLIGYVTLYHLLVTHVILSLYRVRALLFLVLCVLIIISHI